MSVKLEKGSGPLGDIGVDDFVLTQGTCKYLILINIHDQWNLKFCSHQIFTFFFCSQ